MARVLKVGLTGGIACGRSTVAGFLAAPGRLILDADEVTRQLIAARGEGVAAVAGAFGPGVVAKDGGIDRAALARIVFADAEARARLEHILHPRILARIDHEMLVFEQSGKSGIVIVDAALMVETGSWRRFQRLVVVHCPAPLQKERLMKRDGLTAPEVEARIAAQKPLEAKIALADYLIDSSGTLAETRERALRIGAMLEEDLKLLPDLPRRAEGGGPC